MSREIIVSFLIAAFIRILWHVVLLILPLREFLRWREWRAGVFLTVSVLLASAISYHMVIFVPSPYNRFLVSCCGLIFTYIICQCMTKVAPFPLLFVVLFQASYGDCITLLSRITNLIFYAGRLNYDYQGLTNLVITLISLPAMYLVMHRYIRPLLLNREHRNLWRTLWLIPAFYYIIFRLGVYPGYFPSGTSETSPWMLLLLLWPVAMLTIYLVVLKLMHNLFKKLKLQAQLENNKTLLLLQQNLYEQQRTDIERARIARHDMRHHLIVVQGLLDAGELEEAERYLLEAIAEFEKPGSTECLIPSSGRNAGQHAARRP